MFVKFIDSNGVEHFQKINNGTFDTIENKRQFTESDYELNDFLIDNLVDIVQFDGKTNNFEFTDFQGFDAGKRVAGILMDIFPEADKSFEVYGIFNTFAASNYKDNCLIKALKANDIDDGILNVLKTYTKGKMYVPTSSLSKISEILG